MKHKKTIVLGVGVLLAFAAGHLTAQPVLKKPAPPVDPEKEAFMADYGGAIRFNNQTKLITMMDEAVGDAKFTDALIRKTWDMAINVSNAKAEPMADRRDLMQSTFLMKQQQKQIELLSDILSELKNRDTKAK